MIGETSAKGRKNFNETIKTYTCKFLSITYTTRCLILQMQHNEMAAF